MRARALVYSSKSQKRQEPEYENHFGYKRPKQKSQSAYDMLTKIEKESEPGERSLALFKKHTVSIIDNLSDIRCDQMINLFRSN